MESLQDAIKRLADKDEEAFNQIYEQTKNVVFAVIYAITKERFSAEDLMQDTYMTMLEKIHQYQPKYSFQSWLVTIARNKAIDYYRRKQKEYLVDSQEEERLFPEQQSTSELHYLLDDVIQVLNERQRSIFLLYITKTLTFQEIAKIMECPLGTILWEYRRAVNLAKKRIGGE